MEILNYLFAMIGIHPYISSLLVGFISEELLIFLAVLSGKGEISFLPVFIFGLIGVFLIDCFWYFLGRSSYGKKVYEFLLRSRNTTKTEHEHKFVNKKRHFLYITLSKFVYGTRNLTDAYFGIKNMPFKKFLVYDIGALLIWSSIMLSAGWLAGKGFDILLKYTKGVQKLFAFLFIAVIIVLIVRRLLKIIFYKHKI